MPTFLKTFLFLLLINAAFASTKEKYFAPETLSCLLSGINNLYNLEFEKADYYFDSVLETSSNCPASFIYLAVTTIGRETLDGSSEKLERKTQLYIDDALKAALRTAFSTNEPWSNFFAGEAFLLKSYLESKQENYISSLRWLKHGLNQINKAGAFEEARADANMILGAYKFYVSYMPWYIRYFATLFIEPTSKEQGLERLEDAASNAVFVRAEAQMLLAAAFLWEREPDRALEVVSILSRKFPDNFFLATLKQKILVEQRLYSEAYKSATNNLRKIENDNRFYVHGLLVDQYYELGLINTAQSNYYKALANFASAYKLAENKPHYQAWSLLRQGTVYDMMNQRDMAIKCYHASQKTKFDSELLRNYCKTFLKYPYKGEILE